MTPDRFDFLTQRYSSLTLALLGDFCLDRYFDIDPNASEISIETGLPVHNIFRVRCLPGAAGTILNNLAALGVGRIRCIGIRGDDGEGFELQRALTARSGADLDGFITVQGRHTFTYTKPLLHRQDHPPEELSRLDLKNTTPTPAVTEAAVISSIDAAEADAQAWIVLDQVDLTGTGVITASVLDRLNSLARRNPALPILVDSRRGLRGWPKVVWKMNAAELERLSGRSLGTFSAILDAAGEMAASNQQPVFITLAELGIIGANPRGVAVHVPAFPVNGPIDIVGAGDSVSANLTLALAAGASLEEAMEMAMAAAHLVIHQLGTTGTASITQIRKCLFG